MREHEVERSGHLGVVERLDEETRVADLPAAAAAHEAPELVLGGPALPLRLLLQGAEGAKVPVSLDDLLDRVGTEGANQLLFEVGDAHVEAQAFHVVAREVGAEPGTLETAAEVAFLFCVAEAGQFHVESLRAESMQEPPDRLCPSDRHDGDALGVEVAAAPFGERFDRALVADPFDQHDGVWLLHGETVLLTLADRRRDTPDVRDGKGPGLLAALLIGWGVNVVTLLVVDSIFEGVEIGRWGGVLIGAAVLGIANAIVKPILTLLALPFILITLGLVYFAINVLMLAIAEWVAPDFSIDGFWTYIGATIVVWLVNWILHILLGMFGGRDRAVAA